MNNHAGLALTRPTGTTFSYNLPLGEGCLGYPRPYNQALNKVVHDILKRQVLHRTSFHFL